MRHRDFVLRWLAGCLAGALCASTSAQPATILHTFNSGDNATNSSGAVPLGGLLLSGNLLYGTTSAGGSNGAGTVFSVNSNGSGLAVIHAFAPLGNGAATNSEGANPQSNLLLAGGRLYGTTLYGGSDGAGTIYAVNTNGTGFTVLHTFTVSDGANPYAGLAISGGTLYGAAFAGGARGKGTLFSLGTNGANFAVLHDFNGSTDGAHPAGTLVLAGGSLYGTAEFEGPNFSGTVFSIGTDGSNFKVLYAFSALDPVLFVNADGAYPQAGLLLSGSVLYGSTQSSLFSLNTNGAGFSVLHYFADNADGSILNGNLALAGNALYGTAYAGGTNFSGTLFSQNTGNTNFTVLYTFSGADDGGAPNGGVVLNGNSLIGTASSGGTNFTGSLFSLELANTNFTAPYSFAATTATGNFDPNQQAPAGGPVESGGVLYGTTQGGAGGSGTIYAVATSGANFRILHEFTPAALLTNLDGSGPRTGLLLYSNYLFGVTGVGGTNGGGTIFSITTGGTNFAVLHDFSFEAFPYGDLFVSGNTLYGTTAPGGQTPPFAGTVYSVGIDGSGFHTIHTFGSDQTQGVNPYGGVVVSGNTIYGVTAASGANGSGTIFAVNTDDSNFRKLHTFSAVTYITFFSGTNSDGASPHGGMVLASNTLYGTTEVGGLYSGGTIFSVNTNGSNFQVLHHFNPISDGAGPWDRLVLSGDTLYGTTPGFGDSGGTIFSVKTNGDNFAVLYDFLGVSDGFNPGSTISPPGVAVVGNTIYSAASGGAGNSGTVISWTAPASAPVISGIELAGTNLIINVNNGASGAVYVVLMTTNLAVPPAQWTPVFTNAPAGSGSFTIVATNAVSPGAGRRFYLLRAD